MTGRIVIAVAVLAAGLAGGASARTGADHRWAVSAELTQTITWRYAHMAEPDETGCVPGERGSGSETLTLRTTRSVVQTFRVTGSRVTPLAAPLAPARGTLRRSGTLTATGCDSASRTHPRSGCGARAVSARIGLRADGARARAYAVVPPTRTACPVPSRDVRGLARPGWRRVAIDEGTIARALLSIPARYVEGRRAFSVGFTWTRTSDYGRLDLARPDQMGPIRLSVRGTLRFEPR